MKNDFAKPLHVLFVDDDSDESYLFNEALEHAGLHIKLSKAKDGNGLIHFLKTNPLPDLVLIDLNMPYKDGIEALSEIRSTAGYEHLPLVIYSTTRNNNYIDKCYIRGANLFVVKPNDFDGLVEVVKKICTIDWTQFQPLPREEFVIYVDEDQLNTH
ncbi:response regulator [Aridibaculum aurantiacum]|uniref:response regulator n=1 Tax=Aridibaculum aurantiacum TaxID=2810307 RepID=UPI001A978BE9|nr:response regulator [Aridibaculum aurantiacum]